MKLREMKDSKCKACGIRVHCQIKNIEVNDNIIDLWKECESYMEAKSKESKKLREDLLSGKTLIRIEPFFSDPIIVEDGIILQTNVLTKLLQELRSDYFLYTGDVQIYCIDNKINNITLTKFLEIYDLVKIEYQKKLDEYKKQDKGC